MIITAKTITLVGTPNCGKTTFFDLVTKSRSATGNWPGVTVEKKAGKLKSFTDITVIDLPGTYSLSPYSTEEKVTCDFISKRNFDFAICIIDGTNPEPGIYLALEMISKKLPLVLAVNYSDDMKKKKISVNIDLLSSMLDIPVFLISSKSGEGVPVLISFIAKKNILLSGFSCSNKDLHDIAGKTVSACFTHESYSENVLEKADRFLSERRFSVLVFVLVAFTAFAMVFGFPGTVLKSSVENLFEILSKYISSVLYEFGVSETIISLINDGIISGMSSVLSFLPQLVLIFALTSFLEDSGYLSRIAFILDKPMRKIGLSGHSVIPILLGFGCSVPAIMASKSNRSEKEQLKTISFLPFIPCGAKLPTYFMFAETMFPEFPLFAILFIYCFSIFTGVLYMKITSVNSNSGFVLELPPYRVPSLNSIFKNTIYRCRSFVVKISKVILIVSVAVWFISYFTPGFTKADSIDNSIIALLGKYPEPFFAPIGFTKEILVAAIFGLFAKESALSVLNILSFGNISEIFDFGSSVSFLIFFTLYSPCFAALSTVKEEFGIKKAAGIFIFQTAFAYISSFVFYKFYLLITEIF